MAKVRKGEKIFYLCKNKSTYISIEVIHSVESSKHMLLELIEIQTGSCLNKDNIHCVKIYMRESGYE